MEVKEGYKKTEVGVIPEDWEVARFTEIAELKHGFQFMEEHFSNSGIGVIKIGNLNNSAGLDLKRLTYIPSERLNDFKKFILSKGDILMALTGATLGKVAVVDNDELLLQNYRVGNFIPNEKTIKDYLYHISQSFLIQRTVKFLVNEAAQPNLGKADFYSIFIPLPPLPEQTAIATVLSDTDNLIQALEKKIVKKELIKKGAMQQLLEPKEGWERKTIGEVFTFKQGVQCAVENQSKQWQNGLKRFIRIIDLTQKEEPPRYIVDPGYAHHIQKDDLFMVRYGNPGLLGFGYEGVIANNLFSLTPLLELESLFFYYLLTSKKDKILELSSSTTMAAVNFTSLKNLEVIFPKSKEKQTHIAQILSDMDNEIESLQEKLSKYKQLKQGLMQELLTGRIRLV